jgi:hypothetical protein
MRMNIKSTNHYKALLPYINKGEMNLSGTTYLMRIIGNFWYSYEEGLDISKEEIAKNIDINTKQLIKEFKEIFTYPENEIIFLLSQILSWYSDMFQGFDGMGKYEEVKEEYWVRVWIEKVYFDLFHDRPEFDHTLLKYIDPKTGELKNLS